MTPEQSRAILTDVQERLLGIMDSIKELPQGYRYKVQELLSCAETVVSMYNDIQGGTIPEILQEMRNEALNELIPESADNKEDNSTKLDLGNFSLDD